MPKLTRIYVKAVADEAMGVHTDSSGLQFSFAVVMAQVFEVEIGETPFLLAAHLSLNGRKYVVTDVRSGCQWPDHIQQAHFLDEHGRKLGLVGAAKQYVDDHLTRAARNQAGPLKVAARIASWPPIRDALVEAEIIEPDEVYPVIE